MSDSPSTERVQPLRRAELLWPAAAVLLLVAAKVVYTNTTSLAPGIFDATVYMDNARSLLDHLAYGGTHYPPLYSAALAPAFLVEDHWSAILVLNAFYSSLLLVPTYLLARLVMHRTPALLVAAVVALLPYHLVFPAQVFSENIYFAILLFTVYAVVRRPERYPWAWDALTGALLGALWLTRHLTIALLPAFFAAWWLRELLPETGSQRTDWRGLGVRFAVLLGTAALVYVPWPVMQLGYGEPLPSVLGFDIGASSSEPRRLTLGRLAYWATQYAAYFVLLAAPVANLLALGATRFRRSALRTPLGRLSATTGFLVLTIGVAVTRHSWQAPYNSPDPAKLMGRYVIYFAALFLITGFAILVRYRRPDDDRWRFWLVTWLIPAVLVALAHAIVIGGLLHAVGPQFITDRGGVDAFKIRLMGPAFFALVFGVWAIVDVLLWRGRRRAALWALFAGLLVISLWGLPEYHARLIGYRIPAAHGKQIAALDIERGMAVLVGADVSGVSAVDAPHFKQALDVAAHDAGREDVRVILAHEFTPEEAGESLLLEVRLADHAEGIPGSDVLSEYEFEEHRYAIVVSPLDSGRATAE